MIFVLFLTYFKDLKNNYLFSCFLELFVLAITYIKTGKLVTLYGNLFLSIYLLICLLLVFLLIKYHNPALLYGNVYTIFLYIYLCFVLVGIVYINYRYFLPIIFPVKQDIIVLSYQNALLSEKFLHPKIFSVLEAMDEKGPNEHFLQKVVKLFCYDTNRLNQEWYLYILHRVLITTPKAEIWFRLLSLEERMNLLVRCTSYYKRTFISHKEMTALEDLMWLILMRGNRKN